MTNPTLTCDQFADRLADYLERDATEPIRSAVETHALGCDDCGALLADLRRLRVDAAALPAFAPSRDLWSGIAARIETPVVELTPGGRIPSVAAPRTEDVAVRHDRVAVRRRFTPLWIGLAAAGLVAITATVTHQLTKRAAAGAPPVAVAMKPVAGTDTPITAVATPIAPTTTQVAKASDPAPAARASAAPATSATLVSNKPSAEATYDAEIARLRAIVAQRRATLDTATVGVIERNLIVIDGAIAQCKAALRKDPASRFLMESLNDALDTKVHLLRTAALLPSRT